MSLREKFCSMPRHQFKPGMHLKVRDAVEKVIAERIKAVNQQETVIVLSIPVESHFV